MEEICEEKCIVTGIKCTFGLFGCKTMHNSVYNKTAKKQESFSHLIVKDITHKLMRW